MGIRAGKDAYGDSETEESARGVAELLGLGSENDAERVSLQNDEFAQVDAVTVGTAPTLIDEPSETEFKAFCEECQTGIEWSGRGRKPKRCAEHKTRTNASQRGTSRGASTGRRSTKREAELDDLAYNIAKEIAMFGKLASKGLPVFGVTCVKRANNAGEVCKFYAAKYPAVFDALNTVASIGPGIEAGEIVAELGAALLVDAGRMAPDAMFAQLLGVTATYLEVYPDAAADSQPAPSGGNGFGSVNGHLVPQFQPIP